MTGFLVDLDGVHSTTDFEVIEIVDDSNPYPSLLGIKWDFDNNSIINLNEREMIFEDGETSNNTYKSFKWMKICGTSQRGD